VAEEAACVVAEEAVGMAAEAVTGNREAKQKTEMEVSEMMRIKDTVVVSLTPVAIFLLWTFGFITWILLAEPPGQRTFSSPAQASRALFLAAQAGDERALLEIFGPDGKRLFPVATQ